MDFCFAKNIKGKPNERIAFCGNTVCDAGEDCGTCSSDCGVCPAVPLSCTVKSSCGPGDTGILSLFDTTDSHVGTIDYYTNDVCCKVDGVTLGSDCTEGFIFTKFQADDSHVSTNPGYYTNDVCLSADPGTITCSVEDNTGGTHGACSTGACVATVLKNDDSHAASCNPAEAYPLSICCDYSTT